MWVIEGLEINNWRSEWEWWMVFDVLGLNGKITSKLSSI